MELVSPIGHMPEELLVDIMKWLSSKDRSVICSVCKLFSKLAVECSAGMRPEHRDLYNTPMIDQKMIESVMSSGNYHLIVRLRDPRFINLKFCCHGYMDIVKLMIEHGANYWNGGLRYACEGGHMDVVKLMIERGADRCIY